MIGWSCSESREMISIEVEADNALPFYLLACLPTANAYNRLRTRRAAAINWLVVVLFDFVRATLWEKFEKPAAVALEFRIVWCNT